MDTRSPITSSDVGSCSPRSRSVCEKSWAKFLSSCSYVMLRNAVSTSCLSCFLATTWPLTVAFLVNVIVVQTLSRVWLFATPWTAAHEASLFFTVSWRLLKLMSIESVMPSDHLILCHPLLLLPNLSQHQSLFQWAHSWPQVAKVIIKILKNFF